jgi:NAD(P)-dependent dehydrogenase (short-subunit alcohol dehydrogenase family)
MQRLENKTAVVTGGASGIGRAIAEHFVRAGARVVVGDLAEVPGQALADAPPGRIVFVRADVSVEADVVRLVETAVGLGGRLDVFVNNAGIRGLDGAVPDLDLGADYARTVGILLTGVVAGMKHASRAMRATGGGSIINVASIAGLTGGAGTHLYSALKAAVIQLGRVTAAELGPQNIRVNALCPGAIVTPLYLVRNDPADTAETTRRLAILERALAPVQPIPRAGQPDDVAAAAVYFASDESSFVTGQALAIDGGLSSGIKLQPEPGAVQELLRAMGF